MSKRQLTAVDLRDVEPMLEQVASTRHKGNKSEAIREAVRLYYGQVFSLACVGWVQLDLPADLVWDNPKSKDSACSNCGKSMAQHGAFVPIFSDGLAGKAVCGLCAKKVKRVR